MSIFHLNTFYKPAYLLYSADFPFYVVKQVVVQEISTFSMEKTLTSTPIKMVIWIVSASFVLFQFFLQLSSGIIIGYVMADMRFSALAAGVLSSAFYYVYTVMQIPVGLLFDRGNTRLILSIAALSCSLGCYIFSQGHTFFLLFCARLLMGAGASFAFVGLSHVLRKHFALNHFSLLIGLSETLAFFTTVAGILGMGIGVAHSGWRTFMQITSIIGLLISFLLWKYIPRNTKKIQKKQTLLEDLLPILASKKTWINGIFAGLSFSVITVFGALWGVSFLQIKLECTLAEASIIDAFIFLGAALSCPLFGYLDTRFKKTVRLMAFSSLITTVLLLITLWVPLHSFLVASCLMLLIGICCGGYILSFALINELSPRALSMGTGFTNTLAMLSAPILQPLIGYLIDITNYQYALSFIPLCLLLACFLLRGLRH